MAGKYIIAVHSYTHGTSQSLRDYLLKKGEQVLWLEQPLLAPISSWLWGFLRELFVLINSGKHDVFIGANCLNAFLGIVIKKLGKVKKVVYFFHDYTNPRFKNKLLDNLYWWLDYYCIRKADYVWNSSSPNNDRLALEHLKRGVPPKYLPKQRALPEGTIEQPLNFNPKKLIVFTGHLIPGLGVELMLESFKELTTDWSLCVIGDGSLFADLIIKYQQDKNINFVGRRSIDEVYKVLGMAAFSMALYEPGYISQYTDSGKVKNYISCGLPVIMTRYSPIWSEIEANKAGIIVEYNKESVKKAMLELMNNQKLLMKYRFNAYEMAQQYRWEKIFADTLHSLR